MKKKSASRSTAASLSPWLAVVIRRRRLGVGGFFNLRVLMGLFIGTTGIFLALAGLGVFSALAQSTVQGEQKHSIITNSKDPLVPNGFDCSKIHELGIDKQMNFRARAIMIACGQAHGAGTSTTSPASPLGALTQFIKKLFSPLAYGGTDVDLITGTDNAPQSTTFSWGNPDNPDQIVVAYNDGRGYNASPPNFSGASVSTDGGLTFDRLTCPDIGGSCTQIGQANAHCQAERITAVSSHSSPTPVAYAYEKEIHYSIRRP